MAVGFVAYGLLNCTKTVTAAACFYTHVAAAVSSYFIKTLLYFPIILIVAGCITAFNYKAHPRETEKKKFDVAWSNLVLWLGFSFLLLSRALTKSSPNFCPLDV